MTQQLHMIWPEGLRQAPELIAPDGYEIRLLRKGDESGHVHVMHEAGFSNWDEAKLVAWQRRTALPEGIFVAVHKTSGQIAATALASHMPTELHPSGGELGWVAASPDHAGKGLGKVVSVSALRRLLHAGYRCVYLLTDDNRLAAIKTYLRMGFLPFLFAPDMEPRWRVVCEELNWPLDPKSWVKAPEEQWVQEPSDIRHDNDQIERYSPRHQWLPNREHRGFSCNGDVDAFGDESLYKPSHLGFANAEPCEVEAGTHSPLTLTFTAGLVGIPEGATVTFAMRGQAPLGRLRGLTLSCSVACELEEKGQGFVVKKGQLTSGDSVILTWPAFQWTPLAGRREFKVIINYGNGRPEQRFPEPVVIQILSRAFSCLEATIPCTHRSGHEIDVRVTARDEYDNRVPLSCEVRLATPQGEQTLTLADGMGTYCVHPAPDKTTRISVQSNFGGGSCKSNPSVPTDGQQVFVGDLHCHDFMSEAEGYTDDVYRWAIDDRRLDFISVVPQSHGWHDNETWTIVKYMNERFLDEGKFVPLLGFEWQHTGYGDKVVHYLGGDQPYLPRDDVRYQSATGLYDALRYSDALVISHHPSYPRGSWCSSTDFDAVETDVERLVELWSMHGSSEGYDPADRPFSGFDPDRLVMSALKRGVRLGFTGGSDTHSARPGGSAKEPKPYWGGLTAVWADHLTRRDLFHALYERRTYALTCARIILRFEVNGQPMGSETEACETAEIHIDAWAPNAISKVEVLKNASLLRQFDQTADECHIDMHDKTDGATFYHCRVTLEDGNLAVCSPVWLG